MECMFDSPVSSFCRIHDRVPGGRSKRTFFGVLLMGHAHSIHLSDTRHHLYISDRPEDRASLTDTETRHVYEGHLESS